MTLLYCGCCEACHNRRLQQGWASSTHAFKTRGMLQSERLVSTRMAWKFAEIDKKALLDHNVQLQKRIVAMEEGCATLARL